MKNRKERISETAQFYLVYIQSDKIPGAAQTRGISLSDPRSQSEAALPVESVVNSKAWPGSAPPTDVCIRYSTGYWS